MRPDERYRAHFDAAAHRYEPDPGSLEAVGSKATHRRRKRAFASAAIVVFVGVGSVLLVRPPGAGFVAQPVASTTTVPATTTAAGPDTSTTTSAPTPEPTVVSRTPAPNVAWQRVTDLPDSNPESSFLEDPVVFDGGFLTIKSIFEPLPSDVWHENPAVSHRLWTSTDGVALTVTDDDPFGPSAVLNELTATPLGLFVAGTIGDGATWTQVPMQLPPPAQIDTSYQKASYGIDRIVAGPHGVMVLGGRWTTTDWPKLVDPYLPDGKTMDAGEYSLTFNGDTITVYEGRDQQHLLTLTSADLGMDLTKAGDVVREPFTWYSTDGTSLTLIDTPGSTVQDSPHFASVAVATERGFVVFVPVPADNSSDLPAVEVWETTDGTAWEQVQTSGLPGAGFLVDTAYRDGRIVVIGGTPSGPSAWVSTDAATWAKVASSFGTRSQLETIAVGPAGWAVTGKATNTMPPGASPARWAPAPAVWTSADGIAWKPMQLPDDVFGLAGIPFFGRAAIGADTILLAGSEMNDFSNGSTGNPTRVIYVGRPTAP